MAIKNAVELSGLREVKQKLTALLGTFDMSSRKTAEQIKDVAYGAGAILRDQARANAPHDPARKKGTHLRDAIFVNRGNPERPDVLVGVRYKQPGGAPHAHLVEYGSARSPAHPFMRPAISQTSGAIAEHIETGLKKIVGDQVK